MLSSGAKRDLLVLCFAKSMIDVSKGDEAKSDDNLSPRTDNKDYKINKRIDNNLERINVKLNNTIQDMYEAGGIDTATWVKKNLNKRIAGTLTQIQEETINLEMLAIWILYVNFGNFDKRKLHDNFMWIRESDDFIKIADLMEETGIANIQGEMFNTAYDVIARIKG